jgi:alkanesulfonate monooxygenase SsuD/methylene tetrahydromethanopterin reductase-like flavin-dependent oxidoreductase (luciferase family)
MDFGIFLAPAADSWKLVKRAKELGYRRAWFYDTQLLNSELFVSMAAAAMQTSTIRLATGVLIPSNRIAPVTASALASLNALAPGRIDFGVSTGFTARRTMGLRPVKLADLEEYLRVVRGLLAGDTLEWSFEGSRRKIRFLNPEIGAVNIGDPIPLHVAATGPRARRLAGKLGAGWIHATANLAHGVAAMADMQSVWRAAGRDVADLHATATVAGCVLGDGEALDSPRVRAQAGPTATIALHSLVERETFGDLGRPLPAHLAPLLERYRQIYLAYEPSDARYLQNHRGHLMFLRPEEQEVCTAELIGATTFTSTKAELQEQLRELGRAGFAHVGITIRYGHPEMLEEWADVIEGV